jgi:hypothetical protein
MTEDLARDFPEEFAKGDRIKLNVKEIMKDFNEPKTRK